MARENIKKSLGITAGIILALCLIALGFVIVKHKKRELSSIKPPEAMSLPVVTSQVRYGSLEETRRYLGVLEAKVKADIAPRITAEVIRLYVREGDLVKRGQLLVELDAREQDARIGSLNAELIAAKTALMTYEGIYQRDLELYWNKALSKEALDRSKMALESARAKVKDLENQLDAAVVQRSYTKLKAPFDGTIVSRWIEQSDMALSGRPVLGLESNEDGYKLVLKVPQALFPVLKKGMKVGILPFEKGQERIEARISRLYPGTLPGCEIDLPERPFELPTGSKLYVMLHLGKATGFILPSRALLEQAEGPGLVFPIDEDGRVKKIPVKPIARSHDLVCLLALQGGLFEGQKVVVAGEDVLLRLKKGQKVRPYSETLLDRRL